MRDHKKLRAFELADQVVMEVYRTTRNFPKDELSMGLCVPYATLKTKD